MELFVNIYLYEFVVCLVRVCIRCFGLFMLINLSYGITEHLVVLYLM